MNLLLVHALNLTADKPPEAKDVVAGWTAFAIFIGLGIAVALLCWSLVRQLKKVNKAEESGVYGEHRRRGASSSTTEDDDSAQS